MLWEEFLWQTTKLTKLPLISRRKKIRILPRKNIFSSQWIQSIYSSNSNFTHQKNTKENTQYHFTVRLVRSRQHHFTIEFQSKRKDLRIQKILVRAFWNQSDFELHRVLLEWDFSSIGNQMRSVKQVDCCIGIQHLVVKQYIPHDPSQLQKLCVWQICFRGIRWHRFAFSALGAVLCRNAAMAQPHHILCCVFRAVQAINASTRRPIWASRSWQC